MLLACTLSIISVASAEDKTYTITETQITTSGKAFGPSIYGDKIVYQNGQSDNYPQGIYVHDLSTGRDDKITGETSPQGHPVIYEDLVAWTHSVNSYQGYTDIYMRYVSGGDIIQVTTDNKSSWPAIYGDKIVYQNGTVPYVYVYDIPTGEKTKIADSGNQPAIYGNRVTYQSNYNVFYCDISDPHPIQVSSEGRANYVAISGDKIVFENAASPAIRMYDITTGKTTAISNEGRGVVINGDRIAWEMNGNIYMYNISDSQTVQITQSGYATRPAIYGDRVVWMDQRKGDGSVDIYMATVTVAAPEPTPNTPPTVAPVSVTNTESSTPTISWTYSDADNDPQKQYELEVWTGQGGTGTNIWSTAQISMDTSVTYGGSKLDYGNTYYVRVKANDGVDWGDWSETSLNWIIDDTTPPDINIETPTDGQIITDETPRITVSGSATDSFGISWVAVNGQIAGENSATWFAEIPLVTGENKIEVVATDNNLNQATKTINVKYQPVSPPEPKVEYEIWQNNKKADYYILDKKDPYEIRINITNTDDSPHYYSLKLVPTGNDITTNWKWLWEANPHTTEIKNDMQTNLIQPGNTVTYYYEFKSDWYWIPPKDMFDIVWDASWDQFYSRMAEFADPKLAIYLDIQEIIEIVAESKIGIPIVNFNFEPSDDSTQTLKGPESYVSVPLYVGQTKVQNYQFYSIDRYVSMLGFAGVKANPAYGTILGVAAIIDSGLSYTKAFDPQPNYTEVVQPEPYNVPEIDSLPSGIYKEAAQETFDMLSYSRAEEISYIRYAGAVQDDAYEYELLQLEAAKKYNDECLHKIENLNNIYKLLILNQEPMTDQQIEDFKATIDNEGLPPVAVSILTREGLEGEIPSIIEMILNSKPELYKDPTLILEYNSLNAKLRSDISNEYMKEIINISVDQLGQPVGYASSLEIEKINELNSSIQADLDKGYASPELREDVQTMLNLSRDLIVNTKNSNYLNYYYSAQDAWLEYLSLPSNYEVEFLSPINEELVERYPSSTIQIIYSANDKETGEFVLDSTSRLIIKNSTGFELFSFVVGEGKNDIRVDAEHKIYSISIPTEDPSFKVGENYSVLAIFGDIDYLKGSALTHFKLIDKYSLAPISNLQSTNGTTWINWIWANPTDSDFNHTEIYLNGTFQTNTSVEYFNATGLEPETEYTIGTRTVDIYGNVNETWVNLTATTTKEPVIVEAGSDQTVDEGSGVDFEGSFTASGSHTYSYHWDFGDGSAEDSSLTTSHTYADNGVYTVNLTVTDEEGDSGNDTLLVTVNNALPVVDSGSDLEVTAGDLVSFTGTFSDIGWLDTHTAQWNFGEGTIEAGSVSEENEYPDSTGTVSGSFSYFDAGEYTVTLNVADDDGGIGQDQLTVAVRPIEAEVTFDPETFYLNSTGEWVTAYIELPAGYSVSDIDIGSVLLNGTVHAVSDPKYDFVTNESEYLKDLDLDGISERMFKFNRGEVAGILKAGDQVTVTFTGKVEYNNGVSSGVASFEGSDVIKVTQKDSKNDKTK